MMRVYTDRIMIPKEKKNALTKLLDCIKSEFLCGPYLDTPYLDRMVLGNYHERPVGSHVKLINQGDKLDNVREKIKEKIRSYSANAMLETFVDAPDGPKEIFRLSRMFFKMNSHSILIGPPGSGKIRIFIDSRYFKTKQ